MKIHLVGCQESNKGWAFEAKVMRALKRMGHEVISTDYRMNRDSLWEKLGQECDLLLVCRGDGIPPRLISGIPFKTALWFCELIGSEKHVDDSVQVRRMELDATAWAYDYVFIHDESGVPIAQKMGSNVLVAPCAVVDPTVNYKLTVEKDIDVLFVGTPTGRRKEFFDKLNDPRVTFASSHDPAEVNELYNRAKIVLNVHLSEVPNTETRIGEVLGAGSFCLTEELSMPKMFTRGVHLGTFSGVEGCRQKINYYLDKHPKECDAVAENGHKHIMENHTIDARLKEMLEAVK